VRELLWDGRIGVVAELVAVEPMGAAENTGCESFVERVQSTAKPWETYTNTGTKRQDLMLPFLPRQKYPSKIEPNLVWKRIQSK
jgi:hypothetical protein